MDIVESDLKQLFMWIKNLDSGLTNLEEKIANERINLQSLEKRIDYGYEKLEKRINDIEHD